MAQEKNYPEIHQHFPSLMGQYQRANPSVMQGFGSLHPAAVADGSLDPKTKELIALGIATALG